MPVVISNPNYPYQSGASPFNKAFSVQSDFRTMIGELTQWNPNLDSTNAGRMINNRYRRIIDRRAWYGTRISGIASTPPMTSTGMVTTIQGSPYITGTNTNWDTSLIGQQFRTSMMNEWDTVLSVDPVAQVITLTMPYVPPGTTSTGYQITTVYLTFGNNIKRLVWATNKFWGWPIRIDVADIQTLNFRDTWRVMYGWTTDFITRSPSPDGQLRMELWPPPYQFQEFPFGGFIQPPEMRLDTDAPVAWIPSDVVVTGALADALLFRPKQNPYYSEGLAIQIAAGKRAQYEADCLAAENADEGLKQQAVQWDYGFEDNWWGPGVGSLYGQMHP